MKSYALFQEYIWLVNTIHKAGRLTLEEINQRWLRTEMSEGISIARSTFNRHRDAILDMFGIVIECDKKDGFRYYIYNEEVLQEKTIQNWMLSTLSANIVLSESKGVHDRIVLESIPTDGENLHKFIEAMKRGVRISVQYKKYGTDKTANTMTVEPYFVKLFERRWYGIVKSPGKGGWVFTLAFDRILSLEITEDKFKYDDTFDPAAFHEQCYGVIWKDDVPIEDIVIRAYGTQANYLRDLPLHHSQEEIATTDEYSDFKMRLRPTYDFFLPIIAHGPTIKVLEPQWVADKVRESHLAALELYK